MNRNRLTKIGIKQLVRLEWMDKTLNLTLSGMPVIEIRKELDQYLSDKKPSGGIGVRGSKTYSLAINMLAVWFNPTKELVGFRDRLLTIAAKSPPSEWLFLHWAIMTASYPFWFNVATQVGKVLALQCKVTQKQIFDRVVELYGDRSTVLRNARYTVRSFIAWGILEDTDIKGKYQKAPPIMITDKEVVEAMIESILFSTEGHKASLHQVLSSTSLFPFQIDRQISIHDNRTNSSLIIEPSGERGPIVYLYMSTAF